MLSTSREWKLFGLDLSLLWGDLARPWRSARRSPVFSWLQPEAPVRLHSQGMEATLWRPGGSGELCIPVTGRRVEKRVARFKAIQLPEELFLHRSLAMRGLSDEQLMNAAALDAQSNSPFGSAELVWGCGIQRGRAGENSAVHLALASRKQIDLWLDSLPASMKGTVAPEVWAVLDNFQAAVVIGGFGEHRRARFVRTSTRTAYALAFLALLLGLALALTPTLQLRARALEAEAAYRALGQKTAPIMKKREAVAAMAEETTALAALFTDRLRPLPLIEMLTTSLPDDVVLQRFQVEGHKVLITGQAANAAALMQQLGALPNVRDVRAPSPATRPPGTSKESFQIEFTLQSFDPVAYTPVGAPKPLSATPPGGAALSVQGAADAQAGSGAASAAAGVPVARDGRAGQ